MEERQGKTTQLARLENFLIADVLAAIEDRECTVEVVQGHLSQRAEVAGRPIYGQVLKECHAEANLASHRLRIRWEHCHLVAAKA